MKSILILTDFSDAAYHAAEYACSLARQMQSECIVLFHAYQTVIPTTDVPVSPVKDASELAREQIQSLEELAEKLQDKVNKDTEIILRADEVVLPESLNEICRREKTELVVMGITGKSQLEKLLIGSKAIDVLGACEYPVLLVPPAAPVVPVENIIFTTDLTHITQHTPLPLLDHLLKVLQARLWVLNVAPQEEHYTPDLKTELTDLRNLLEPYTPTYEFLTDKDAVHGILSFAQQKTAPLIVMVHKNQGLFHRSITKKLAYETLTPVITFRQLH
jgi:nucleotide-binding universal stress UspA family protein